MGIEAKRCAFELAWIGQCGRADCREHMNLKCSSCGAPATGECCQTMGSFVCGHPLCSGCDHDPRSAAEYGLNHCKKQSVVT